MDLIPEKWSVHNVSLLANVTLTPFLGHFVSRL